jgi:hypothetical protein
MPRPRRIILTVSSPCVLDGVMVKAMSAKPQKRSASAPSMSFL